MLTESEKRAAALAEELRQALKSPAVSPQAHGSSRTTIPPPAAMEDTRPQDPVTLPPGARPEFRGLGQFRVLRRLGEGGMGTVYLGDHEEQGRHVAIKVLSDPLAQNQAYVERFY